MRGDRERDREGGGVDELMSSPEAGMGEENSGHWRHNIFTGEGGIVRLKPIMNNIVIMVFKYKETN